MRIKDIIVVALCLAAFIGIIGYPEKANQASQIEPIAIPEEPKREISHRQRVWMGMLEWCESRGNPQAINRLDRDGTPSYGAFQFKPSTFFYYGKKYGITNATGTIEQVMDRDKQARIVEEMLLHYNDIRWTNEFPDCIRRNGMPPKEVI